MEAEKAEEGPDYGIDEYSYPDCSPGNTIMKSEIDQPVAYWDYTTKFPSQNRFTCLNFE